MTTLILRRSFVQPSTGQVIHIPGFESLTESRIWIDKIVTYYNYHHRHSGLKFVTPNNVHEGNRYSRSEPSSTKKLENLVQGGGPTLKWEIGLLLVEHGPHHREIDRSLVKVWLHSSIKYLQWLIDLVGTSSEKKTDREIDQRLLDCV